MTTKMNNKDDVIYDLSLQGQVLLSMGFKKWFLFFFKKLENHNFVVDPLHADLFEAFEQLHNVFKFKNSSTDDIKIEGLRPIINLPPRSGKTTMTIYFIAYSLAINPFCNFIYVSYSRELSNKNKDLLWSIINSQVYKDMYPNSFIQYEQEDQVVDRYWQDEYYKQPDQIGFKLKNGRICHNNNDGVLFASLGSQITGFGAGIRGQLNKFTGCMFVDDPNKPGDIFSSYLLNKVFEYYKNTLLTRLNNSNVALCIIQQRLHINDLTGYVMKFYNDYFLIKKPLVINGVCQLPSQYNERRINELKVDKFLFQAQYQQEPIETADVVVRSDWIREYTCDISEINITTLFITTDVAFSKEKSSDLSCICAWGKSDEELYLIDLIWDKISPDQYRSTLLSFVKKYNKIFCLNKFYVFLSNIYIEKNRNEMLIPEIQKDLNIFVNVGDSQVSLLALKRDKTFTKQARMVATIPHLSQHKVFFPNNNLVDHNLIIKAKQECCDFRLDDSHKHDDFVDNLMDATLISFGDPGYDDDYSYDDCYAHFA